MADLAALGIVFGQIGGEAATRPKISDLGFGVGDFLLWRQLPDGIGFAPLRLEWPLIVEIGRARQDPVERPETAL